LALYANISFSRISSNTFCLSSNAVDNPVTSVIVISVGWTFSKAVDNPDTSDILKYELDVILFCLSPKAVDNPVTSVIVISVG